MTIMFKTALYLHLFAASDSEFLDFFENIKIKSGIYVGNDVWKKGIY